MGDFSPHTELAIAQLIVLEDRYSDAWDTLVDPWGGPITPEQLQAYADRAMKYGEALADLVFKKEGDGIEVFTAMLPEGAQDNSVVKVLWEERGEVRYYANALRRVLNPVSDDDLAQIRLALTPFEMELERARMDGDNARLVRTAEVISAIRASIGVVPAEI